MSLIINNFSIAQGEVRYCTGSVDFVVDITDMEYAVTLSGITITNNTFEVPYNYVDITDGYRLTYTTTPSGNISLNVIASNTNNDVINRYYNMQYGYAVSCAEVNYWGPNKEVPIAVNVSNKAVVPETSYFSTFFKTSTYREAELDAFISVEGSGIKDIECTIYPQSKYFMYGKTYSIKISGVKDFSGNTLPTHTYSFTIENKNI